jgi:hypothetical protein
MLPFLFRLFIIITTIPIISSAFMLIPRRRRRSVKTRSAVSRAPISSSLLAIILAIRSLIKFCSPPRKRYFNKGSPGQTERANI